MSDTHGKRKALGRGLGALLDNSSPGEPLNEISGEYMTGSVSHVRIDQLEPNPFQPRQQFDENDLSDLASSIREHGIIQPLTIRKVAHERYQIISGERRFRASQLAGLAEVPAYVRIANDEQMLEMALVENIQREDLNPLEIALSFQRLLDECRIRQEDLSQKVGKDRSTISNYIRLLKLPGEIQVAVRDNLITMGHARAILGLDNEKAQLTVLKKILERKLSVRQVEDLVRHAGAPSPPPAPKRIPARFEKARAAMNGRFQAKVEVKVNRRGAGSIIISFNSDEDFDRIISKFES